jgi:hypothetical protein
MRCELRASTVRPTNRYRIQLAVASPKQGGSTNPEPGATGFKLRYRLLHQQAMLEPDFRPYPNLNPVATAPGSVFVDPREVSRRNDVIWSANGIAGIVLVQSFAGRT